MAMPNDSDFFITNGGWACEFAARVIRRFRQDYPRAVIIRVQDFNVHVPHTPAPDPNMMGYQISYILEPGVEPLYASGVVRILDESGQTVDLDACVEEFADHILQTYAKGRADGTITQREGLH